MSSHSPPTVVGILGAPQHGKTTLAVALLQHLAARSGANVTPSLAPVRHRLDQGWATWATEWFRYVTAGSTTFLVDCSVDPSSLYQTLPTLDGAIFVIAADREIDPWARTLLLLARQAGVRSLVVFLSHTDLVPEAVADQRELEVRLLMHAYELPGDDLPVVRGNGRAALADPGGEDGRAIDELRAALRQMVRPRYTDAEAPLLMFAGTGFTVQRQWNAETSEWQEPPPGGQRCHLKGRLVQGRLRPGDDVEFTSGDHAPVLLLVQSVSAFLEALTEAGPGDPVDVELLTHVSATTRIPDFVPGAFLAAPGRWPVRKRFRTRFTVCRADEGGKRPLRADSKPVFWIGTAKVKGAVGLEDRRSLLVGETGAGWVQLDRSCLLVPGQSFACRHHGGAMAYGDVEEVLD